MLSRRVLCAFFAGLLRRDRRSRRIGLRRLVVAADFDAGGGRLLRFWRR